MSRDPTLVKVAKPWSPSNPTEAVLDRLTLGLTRRRREQHIRAHYARLDEYRLSREHALPHEVTPAPLLGVAPSAEAIARLVLTVVSNAEAIHIDTYQGYEAILARDADGSQLASSSFAGSLHAPTLYRVGEATGRDYVRDLRSAGTLAVLMTRGNYVDIEGLGPIANEYVNTSSKTGRITDATFLIRGLPVVIAEQFVDSLRKQPAEMLDGVAYTAFADIELPGRSLMQTLSPNQRTDSLFIPGACTEVTVAAMPT